MFILVLKLYTSFDQENFTSDQKCLKNLRQIKIKNKKFLFKK